MPTGRNSVLKPIDAELISLLEAQFGKENVLTSCEHLYVYSHMGEFGVKKLSPPQAILRIKTKKEKTRLEEIIKEFPVQVIHNDNTILPADPMEPYLLVDVLESIGVDELLSDLGDLARTKEEYKAVLRDANSFHQWFSERMQRKEGFRGEYDRGFCVAQSYFDGIQTYSSKGRFLLARGLLKGEIDNSSLLSDSIFSCTACGQCYDQISSETFQINNALLKTRREIVERTGVPKKFHRVYESIKINGNPQRLLAEDRVLWFEEEAEKFPYRGNKVLYWAGCTSSYRLPEIVTATTSVMDKMGIDFGILGEKEGCCGLILYLSGQWREAEENASKVINTVDEAETLVTNCAGCYYMFSQIYARLDVNIPFNILHTSQLLNQTIRENNFELRSLEGNYMWHDPCDLGRHCQVYDPPRDVLNSIPDLNLVEHPLTKEHTLCCGAGGGLWTYNEELTDHISHQKIMETLPKSLTGLITGCPTCLLSMRNTARNLRPGLKLYDLSEVVDKCL